MPSPRRNPTQNLQSQSQPTETDVEPDDSEPKRRLRPEDLREIASMLQPGDLEKIAALNRSEAELKRLEEAGVIPGQHLVATTNLNLTRKDATGKMVAGKAKHGEILEIAHLDPVEVKDLRERRVRPGHGPAPCVLLAEPASADALAVLQG